MQIGAVGFEPYIYNTNSISRSSLGRVPGIEEDLVSSKTDYSDLADESLNENPLKKGETSGFMDVLQMQMHMGQMNASRLIKPIEETEELLQNKVTANPFAETQAIEEEQATQTASEEVLELSDAEAAVQSTMPSPENNLEMAEAAEDLKPADQAAEAGAAQVDFNLFKMQKAAEAYRVNMIA